jgi:HK97 family phage portal protein
MANWLKRLLQAPRQAVPQMEARSAYDRIADWAILVNAGIKNYKAGISEETALSITAVYAAVDRISSSLASIPFNIYQRLPDGTRRLARNYDQFYLVHTRPHNLYTSFNFRKTLIASMLLHGNGYALLQRDPATTRPIGYKLIPPRKVVEIKEVEEELYYFIEGMDLPVPYYDMIHISTMSMDGYQGKSPIRIHAEMLGAAKARNDYSAAVMENGGFMSGIIKTPGVLKPEQKEAIKQGWQGNYGGATNAGKVAVLDAGVDFQQLAMSPTDVQMIEMMKFTVEDIARIYGIPPHMIGDLERSTNNNIEQQSIEFVQYCLMPIAKQIEEAFDSKITKIQERQTGEYYVKLELNALLRGDLNARKEWYTQLLQFGVLSVNEVRQLEDYNGIGPDGDIHMVQANMMPLDQVENFYQSKATNGQA